MTDSTSTAVLDRDLALSRQRRRVAQVLVVVAALALVAALGWGGWWLTHPTAFNGPANGIGDKTPAFAGGKPILVDMFVEARKGSGSVTLSKVEPRVVENSAIATITFHVCVTNGVEAVASVRGRLERWCDEVYEVEDAEWPRDRESPRHQLILAIWDAEPGVLRIEGLDLTYRDGLQKGTQRVGTDVWYRFV